MDILKAWYSIPARFRCGCNPKARYMSVCNLASFYWLLITLPIGWRVGYFAKGTR